MKEKTSLLSHLAQGDHTAYKLDVQTSDQKSPHLNFSYYLLSTRCTLLLGSTRIRIGSRRHVRCGGGSVCGV